MTLHDTPMMTAIGAALLWAGGAMADSPDSAEMDWFAEPMQACIAAPEGDACEQLRSLVEICADDPVFELCGEVFQDARMIFGAEDHLERARQILASTAARMPEFEAPAMDDLPQDALEEARDDAERQLLRTDDNLMTHSTPPVATGDTPDDLETDADAAD